MAAPIAQPALPSRYLAAIGLLVCLVILSLLSNTYETTRLRTDHGSTEGGARRAPLYHSDREPTKVPKTNDSSRDAATNNDTDVSSILDIAIIGFPRSGTTSMQHWLRQSDDVYMDEDEMSYLSHGKVEALVEHFTEANKNHPAVHNAIKFPNDIDTPNGLHTLEKSFPNTKLIVILRHPVLQFESFYNYRHRNLWHQKNITLEDQTHLIGSCRWDQTQYSCTDGLDSIDECKTDNVCTDRGQLHQTIARLGLTPMNSEIEQSLLGGDLKMTVHPWKRPVLFVEMNQLGEGSTQFRQDVQSFLGISNLPERVPHIKEGRLERVAGEIDICSHQYKPLRRILQNHAQRSSEWILSYLLQSELAVVSNRTQFVEFIRQWGSDPCRNRNMSRMESLLQHMHGSSGTLGSSLARRRRHSDSYQQGKVEHYEQLKNLDGKDVRDLLHFAIVGFPKCGTTTMMRWIRSSPSVYMGKNTTKEIALLTHNHPLRLAAMFLDENPDFPHVKNGIKFPGDIDSPDGLDNLVRHYNKTNLIVMIRHPVLWFESFYNFRKLDVPTDRLIGSCRPDGRRYGCTSSNSAVECIAGNVCTDRSLFHQAISRLGLTPMDTGEESELLGQHNMSMHNWTQPVMFVEVNQLKTDNATRTEQLHDDLSTFLNLTDIPPQDLKVYNRFIEVRSKKTRRSRTIDVCSSRHRRVHSVLMDHARSASRWIRKYLLNSELAVVSSRDYFIRLVEDWENDPCIHRRAENLTTSM